MTSSRRSRSPRYLNRELSWLAFNHRVLAEAADPALPLLERVRFLAITAGNLDEFFMVRVGGLVMLAREGRARADISGMTPRQQLREIARRTRDMVERQHALFANDLGPALERAGIRRVRWAEATPAHMAHIEQAWDQEILPLLTPRAIDPEEEFPRLAGLTLHLAARLRRAESPGWPTGEGWAVVAIPRELPRFFWLPSEEGHLYVLAEDIVRGFAERLFSGCEVLDTAVFRITRNADLAVAEDLAADLLANMEDVLAARRESECVRLEIEAAATPAVVAWLRERLPVADEHIVRIPGPLALSDYHRLADLPGAETLRFAPWPPAPTPGIRAGEPIVEQVARRDVLFYVPFESFEPVVRFIEEAADDPAVLAIKQTLYRTSRDSPIIAALARAAANGKQVTAVVELKARFDEARNIEWARELERAGVQVICGVRGFKTHAKVCMVVRREAGGIRRYVHFGTGNYNERTARQYCDIHLISAGDDYGADASTFFNAVTGISRPQAFRRIEVAPLGLRQRLLDLIDSERRQRERGREARIVAKMNSLSDRRLIDALYRASRAGVRIELIVRGVCCLRPGVPGLSENIRVISVIDRFLEHARIFYFHRGGDPAVFISSADWMLRNLDKRVEVMAEIVDAEARRKLQRILSVCLADNIKAWALRPDGSYERLQPPPRGPRVRSQQRLYEAAVEAARVSMNADKTRLVPYRLGGAPLAPMPVSGEHSGDPGRTAQPPRFRQRRHNASSTARR